MNHPPTMTFLRGAHGSRLLHIDHGGKALCGMDTTHQVPDLHKQALLCWGCADIIEDADHPDYPFASIEDQLAELLARMPYRDYLETRHWQWLRNLALDYYGHCCTLCGASESLHVHHRTYERRGRELLSDLTLLCDECHGRFHDKAA